MNVGGGFRCREVSSVYAERCPELVVEVSETSEV